MENKKLINFFYETLMLNRTKRSGDNLVGNLGESVAEHSWRTTIIGFFLAKLEKVDENKVIKMLLFHDLAGARIGELNKVASRYIDAKKAEMLAFKDQLLCVPEEISSELLKLQEEMRERTSKESIVAKDADYVETALTAKEAVEKGIDMKDWIANDFLLVKTKSAKELLQQLEKTSSNEWWKNLKYIPEMNRGKKQF